MATNFDPTLSPFDLGTMTDEPVIEIEILDSDSGIDGFEMDLESSSELPEEFDANLAESMDEGELATLASELIGLVDADINSRKDWSDMFVKGLEVLGMKYE